MLTLRSKRNRGLCRVAPCIFKTIILLTIVYNCFHLHKLDLSFLSFCVRDTLISYLKMGAGLSMWVLLCCCSRSGEGNAPQVPLWVLAQIIHLAGNWTNLYGQCLIRMGEDRTEGSHKRGFWTLNKEPKNKELSSRQHKEDGTLLHQWSVRKQVFQSFVFLTHKMNP